MIVERSFQRVPGVGPADIPSGNEAIKALAAGGVRRDGGARSGLRTVLRYPSARDRVTAALDAIAADHGVSRFELEELSVPDFGLDRDRTLHRRAGLATADVVVADDDGKVRISWMTATGRRQKTAPAGCAGSGRTRSPW